METGSVRDGLVKGGMMGCITTGKHREKNMIKYLIYAISSD